MRLRPSGRFPQLIDPSGQLPGHLEVLDLAVEHPLALLLGGRGLAGEFELFGLVVELLGAVEEVGEAKLEVEVVAVEPGGLGGGGEGLGLVAEAGEDLGEPAEGLGVAVRGLGHLRPGRDGVAVDA